MTNLRSAAGVALGLGTCALPALLAIACGTQPETEYRWGIDPDSLPQVVYEEDIPDLPMGSADWIWQFAGKDLSDKDLSNLSLAYLSETTFDENTQWPPSTRLPQGFVPAEWLERAKDPGLGVRELHRQGITGQGVVVAVIDKPIRHQHQEFGDRLQYHEVFEGSTRGQSPHFHGIACASILAGRTVGVAPEATIHYFATPDVGENFHYYSIAVDSIIAVNRSLPEAERIRLVSISDGLGRDNPYREEWAAALDRLAAAGVEIIYSAGGKLDGFIWGGSPTYANRGDAATYELALYLKGREVSQDRIIIPADYRTTASNIADAPYIYWGAGGWSWAMPYAAGLAALAWQVAPDLTLAEIENLLRETAAPAANGLRVVQPLDFLRRVQP
jgi:subtilisin family serine protease